MARIAKNEDIIESALITNPTDGQVILIEAGNTATFVFDVKNTHPNNPAVFVLALDYTAEAGGLNEGWFDQSAAAGTVRPRSEGQLNLRVTPPATTNTGDYALKIAVKKGGAEGVTCAIKLRVKGVAAPVAVVEPEPKPVPVPKEEPISPPAEIRTTETPREEEKSNSKELENVEEGTPLSLARDERQGNPANEQEFVIGQRLGVRAVSPTLDAVPAQHPIPDTPTPIVEPEIVAETPTVARPDKLTEAIQNLAQLETVHVVEEQVAEPVAPKPLPRPKPAPKPTAKIETPTPAEPPAPTPNAQRPTPVQEVELSESEESGETAKQQRIEEAELQKPSHPEFDLIHSAERSLNGFRITLKPGESRRIGFLFKRTQGEGATYVLEDSRTLPMGWITVEKSAAYLGDRIEEDYSWLLLSIPADAKPDDFHGDRFTVRYGIVGGQTENCTIFLNVVHIIGVKLNAEKTSLSIGPNKGVAKFTLNVANPTQIDTAFRIGVKKPGRETAANANLQAAESLEGAEVIEESGNWDYLFDYEIADAKRGPNPTTIELQLRRRPAFWQGFIEKQTVTVAAVPVTDTMNGGLPGNRLDFNVTKWRLWPLPYWTLFVVAGLFFMLVAGSPGNLAVEDALYKKDSKQDNTVEEYWVSSPGTIKPKLSWNAPLFAVSRVTNTTTKTSHFAFLKRSEEEEAVATEFSSGNVVKQTYEIGSAFGAGKDTINVNFVGVREGTNLTVLDADDQPLTLTDDEDKKGKTLELTVPPSGTKIKIKNNAISKDDFQLSVISPYGISESSTPISDKSHFKARAPGNFNGQKTFRQGLTQEYQFQYQAAGDDDAASQVVLITSDAKCPKLTIKLKKGGS